MLDLFDELKNLTQALNDAGVEYAICGGLALAIHGLARATIDMDVLVPGEALDQVMEIARQQGYVIKAQPMILAGGAVEIRRVSKPDPDLGDLLMLDLLIVTPALDEVWAARQQVEWEAGTLQVVSRAGLIALKSLRRSPQDLVDIERLKEAGDEADEASED